MKYFTAAVIINIILILIGVYIYPLILPVGIMTILYCIVGLLGYLIIYTYVNRQLSKKKNGTKFGIQAGLIIGAFFIFDIILENFVNIPQNLMSASTLVIMLSIFVLFSWSGIKTFRKTKSVKQGVLSSIISALIGVMFALICGFTVNFLFGHHLEQILIYDLEYKFSPVKDIKTFTFYNTLDSASTHLLEAPILASIFGLLGIGINKLLYKNPRKIV